MNNSNKSKRHYLPAASIGFFSAHPKKRRRKSCVAVLRQGVYGIKMMTAENVGWAHGIYGQGKTGLLADCDKYFSKFERLNNSKLDCILTGISNYVNAQFWLQISYYISSLIARNPDLELSKTNLFSNDNINVGYCMDMQRITSAILRARWMLINSDDAEFILPDRGISFINLAQRGMKIAICVPIRRHSLLLIGGDGIQRKILFRTDDQWLTRLEHTKINRDEVYTINACMMTNARKECYASNAKTLQLSAQLVEFAFNRHLYVPYTPNLLFSALGSTNVSPYADDLFLKFQDSLFSIPESWISEQSILIK